MTLEERIRALAPEIAELVARSIQDGELADVAYRRFEGTELAQYQEPGGTGGDGSGSVSVPPVSNVRTVRYDGSQGEVFWDKPDSSRVVSFQVRRNGTLVFDSATLTSKLVSSYYMDDLVDGLEYPVTVVSVDANGALSSATAATIPVERNAPSGPTAREPLQVTREGPDVIVSWVMSAPTKARLDYGPTAARGTNNPGQEDFRFSSHRQVIRDYPHNVIYVRATGEDESGNSYELIADDQDVSSVSSGGNADAEGMILIEPGQFVRRSSGSRAEHSGDWAGRNGFVPDGGRTDAWRVDVRQGQSLGASEMFEIPGRARETIIGYRMLLPSSVANIWGSYNIKLPGPAGDVSGRNGGYGGSQTSVFPHAERAPSARQLVSRPGTSFQAYALGMEIYHKNSTNQGTPDPNDDEYGDTEWYSPSGSSPNGARALTLGQWGEVRVHVKANDLNQSNGFIKTYLDGEEGYVKTGMEWTETEAFLWWRYLWFDVYYGGRAKDVPGTLYMFFRDFRYKVLD